MLPDEVFDVAFPGQCLGEVGDQLVAVFEADRQAQ